MLDLRIRGSKLRAYLELMRIPGPVIMGFSVVLGGTVALGQAPSPGQIAQGFLSFFCLAGAAFVFNDYMDLEGDRLNYPNRPLPGGRVSTRFALLLGIALSASGLVVASAGSLRAFALAAAFLGLAVYYDVSGKRTGLPGNLVVAFCTALTFPFGAVLVSGSLSNLVIMIFLVAFLANAGREVTKSIADQDGDRIGRVRSVALVHGPRVAAVVGAAFFLLTALIGPLIVLGEFGGVGGAKGLPILVAQLGFIYVSVRLVSRPDPRTAARMAVSADVFMIVVVAALLLANLI